MGNVTIVGQATEIMCNNTQVPHGGHQNTKTGKPVITTSNKAKCLA
uniref:PAAR domain-containing protein n=1 Tax=Anguilla anguilla TaxID=7936 RepID=A0A0E9SSN6_ANGAN